MEQNHNNQLPITNQQLELIIKNQFTEISYLKAVNANLISNNNHLTGILLILLIPYIASIAITMIALVAGFNIFSWITSLF